MKNKALAGGRCQDNNRRSSFKEHAVTWWKSLLQDTEWAGHPKGIGQWKRTYPDLLGLKASAVVESDTLQEDWERGLGNVVVNFLPSL